MKPFSKMSSVMMIQLSLASVLSIHAVAQTEPTTKVPAMTTKGPVIDFKKRSSVLDFKGDLNPKKHGYTVSNLPAGDIHLPDLISLIDNNLDYQHAYEAVNQYQYQYLAQRRETWWPNPTASVAPVGSRGSYKAEYVALVNQNIFNWNLIQQTANARFQRDTQAFNALSERLQIEMAIATSFFDTLRAQAALTADTAAVNAFRDVCETVYIATPAGPHDDPCKVRSGKDAPKDYDYTNPHNGPGGQNVQPTDLTTAVMNLINALNEQSSAQNSYETSCHYAMQLTGQSDTDVCPRFKSTPIPDDTQVNRSVDDALNVAKLQNPAINALRRQELAAEANARSYGWQSRFVLGAFTGSTNSLSGSNLTPGSNFNSSITVGAGPTVIPLGLNLNVNGSFALGKQHRAAQSIAHQDQIQLDQFVRTLRQQIQDTSSLIGNNYDIYNRSPLLVNSAKRNYESTLAGFRNNMYNIFDLAQAINALAMYTANTETSALDVGQQLVNFQLLQGIDLSKNAK